MTKAVRRLICEAYLVPPGPIETNPTFRLVPVLSTHLNRARWFRMFNGPTQATLYYHQTLFFFGQQLTMSDIVNETAMAFADDPSSVFPYRRRLYGHEKAGKGLMDREVIVGDALLIPKTNFSLRRRYVRVVRLAPSTDLMDFSAWVEDRAGRVG